MCVCVSRERQTDRDGDRVEHFYQGASVSIDGTQSEGAVCSVYVGPERAQAVCSQDRRNMASLWHSLQVTAALALDTYSTSREGPWKRRWSGELPSALPWIPVILWEVPLLGMHFTWDDFPVSSRLRLCGRSFPSNHLWAPI